MPVEGPRELALLAESFNEIAVALAKAREAERAFLLSVSHELKTPLTAIRGYAEGLGEGVLPADEAAATIVRESQRLERLVGDLLDLARMNKARVQRPPRADRPRRDRAGGAAPLRDAGPRASASRSRPRSPADSAGAIGDADRMLQIVSNLVENALRLTPAGGAVRIVDGAGLDSRRGHRARASGRRSSRRRSSASTSTPATAASARSAPGSGSRS